MCRLKRAFACRQRFEHVIRLARASGGIVGSLHHSQTRQPCCSRDAFSSSVSIGGKLSVAPDVALEGNATEILKRQKPPAPKGERLKSHERDPEGRSARGAV